MANNILKDKDNNILDPKIPRYEKLVDYTLDASTDEINISTLKIKAGDNFQVLIDGGLDNTTEDYENVRCYPNSKSTFTVARVIGVENRNNVVSGILNGNTDGFYIGRSDKNANFLAITQISWQGSYLKGNCTYGSSSIAGFLNSLVDFSDEMLTTLKIKTNSGTFRAGTKIKIYK